MKISSRWIAMTLLLVSASPHATGQLIRYFDVTNTNDFGPGSFRQAILDADSSASTTQFRIVDFAIPGGGVHTITPASPLPEVSKTMLIDGTTQPGYSGTPLIELNLTNSGSLAILADDSGVRGLILNRSSSEAISLEGNRFHITGNYIGTNQDGTAAEPNHSYGIYLAAARSSVIGGTSASDRNVISGNSASGIYFSELCSDDTVEGNYIGTTAAGTGKLGNGLDGIEIRFTSGTTNDYIIIGTPFPGSGNVISGNAGDGIAFEGFVGVTPRAHLYTAQGNFIGTDASGQIPIANGNDGISIGPNSANQTIVGGETAGAGNVISGNGGYGIRVRADNNTVAGNLIGTDPHGRAAIPNFLGGLIVEGSSNAIGGPNPGMRNVISGNQGIFLGRPTLAPGIVLDTNAVGNVISGNIIGADSSGSFPVRNQGEGIEVLGNQNTIGGATPGAGNLITSNLWGITITGAQGTLIQGNTISGNVSTGVLAIGGERTHVTANSIYDNGGLGIDLTPQGGTLNDPCDADTGANNLQNFPELTQAADSAGNTYVTGTIGTTANTIFTIEFFADSAADPTGFGQGKYYLGSTTAVTNGSCTGTFSAVLPALPAGAKYMSATATDPYGNTSEFGPDISVRGAPAAYAYPGFQRTFGGGAVESAHSIIQTSDSGYVVAGYSNSFGSGSDIYLVRMNQRGDTLWAKTLNQIGDQGINSIRQTPDGGFIAVGYSITPFTPIWTIYLLKLSSSGDTVWTRQYQTSQNVTGSQSYGTCVRETQDGGYIFSGVTGANSGVRAFVMKTSSTGDSLWSKVIDNADGSAANSIDVIPDSGYVVVGNSPGYINRYLTIFRLDLTGNLLSEWTYGPYQSGQFYYGNSIERLPHDGGFIVSGELRFFPSNFYRAILMRTDAAGDSLWMKEFGNGGLEYEAFDAHRTSEGGFVVVGQTDGSASLKADAFIIETNAEGDSLWGGRYGGSANDRALSVIQTFDGGYVFAGETDSYGAGLTDMYVVRTGEAALATDVPAVAGTTVPSEYRLSQNYPNPFNPSTVVRYQLPVAGQVRLSVYDILGREVKLLVNEQKPVGNYEVRFDATGLASGIYLYRLTAGSFVQTRKMVLVR